MCVRIGARPVGVPDRPRTIDCGRECGGEWWMPNVWLCRGLVSPGSRAESPNAARCPLLGSLSLTPTSDPTAHHKPTLTRNTAREHRMASNVAAAKQRPAALKSNRRCPQRVQRNGTAPSFLCLAEAEARAVPAAASSGDDTPGGVTVEYQRKVRQYWIRVKSFLATIATSRRSTHFLTRQDSNLFCLHDIHYTPQVAKELIQYFKEKEYEKQVLENQVRY